MSEGWKCPVCGRGVAPSEKTCEHGNAVFTPIHPNMVPMGPPPVIPWQPVLPWTAPGTPVRPYEITCRSVYGTPTSELWN